MAWNSYIILQLLLSPLSIPNSSSEISGRGFEPMKTKVTTNGKERKI